MTQKKENYETFKPTDKGYTKLVNYDITLSEVAREVVFNYMDQPWEQEDHNTKMVEAIETAANWCGFKTTIKKKRDHNGKLIWSKKFSPDIKDKKFYIDLLKRLRQEIDLIDYNENDEYGLLDEIVNVANILSKYKHIIALKRKRKSILEKIGNTFSK